MALATTPIECRGREEALLNVPSSAIFDVGLEGDAAFTPFPNLEIPSGCALACTPPVRADGLGPTVRVTLGLGILRRAMLVGGGAVILLAKGVAFEDFC